MGKELNAMSNNKMVLPEIGLGSTIIAPKHNWNSFKIAYKQKKLYMHAINSGCRLLDTSSAYGKNEEILGEVIKKTGKRSELVLMVKISNSEQRTGNIKNAFENALKKLNTDYIDLLLLHWPQTETFTQSWLQMVDLYNAGKVKSLGVSNFHQHHLEELSTVSDTIPAVNQIELHPLLTQKPLVEYCTQRGIQVISYSPLGRMHDVLIKSKPLRQLSKKYNKTVPQIILRWNLQLGIIPIPRTLSIDHYDEFMNIFDFELTDDEIAQIDSINENIRLRYNPDTCDFSIL